MDPLSLDWGGATAEFQNDEQKSAVHIFLHVLGTSEQVSRAILFAQSRLAYCSKKMPGFSQEVWYDDREQKVAPESKAAIKSAVGGQAGLMFMSEQEG